MTSIESQPTLFQVPKAHLGNIKKCFMQHPGTLILQGLFEGGLYIYILITIVLTYVAWGGRANHDSARN